MLAARKMQETNHPGYEKGDMRQQGTVMNHYLEQLRLTGMALESNLVRTTASLGRFERSLQLILQCFHESKPVTLVTEKVRSPRNEIISSSLHHVGIGRSTIGTLRLRVCFHFPCSLFSAE
jgi:hypothetical protein